MADDKEQQLSKSQQKFKDFMTEEKPNTELEHATAFAYVKGLLGKEMTQDIYSRETGVNSRTLRKYISDNRQAYESELELGKEHAEPDLTDVNTRVMSEEMIDKFIQSLYDNAISGSAKDKELLITFTGMSSQDVLSLQQRKATTLRWFIKSNLNKFQQSVDTKDLGVNLSESKLLNRGDKQSRDNAQNFVNKSITDEGFKLELMYFGAIFMEMFNLTKHPDTEILSKALRINKYENGTAEKLNRGMVKRFSAGKDIKEEDKAVDEKQLEKSLLEIFDKEKVSELIKNINSAKDSVKAPELDVSLVRQRATELQDELDVLLSTEEEMRKLFNKNLQQQEQQ